MKKAYIILAHEEPSIVIQLAKILMADNSHVVVHYDQSSTLERVSPFDDLIESEHPHFHLAQSVNVAWGEWSIVQATLNCLATLFEIDQEFDYVTLLSGSCYPTKPASLLDQHLERHYGKEFIESYDGDNYRWVTDGLQGERWRYYHFLNWRETPFLFDQCLRIQRLVGVNRAIPLNMSPRIGSQWWTLTWSTLKKILKLSEDESLVDFFRKTWIPDELFFQTLVYHIVQEKELITNQSLMQWNFEYKGKPRVFYDDNYCELISSELFFARKISKASSHLRSGLDIVSRMDVPAFISHISEPYNPVSSSLRPANISTDTLFIYTYIDRENQFDIQTGNQKTTTQKSKFFLALSCDNNWLNNLDTVFSQHPDLICHGRLFKNTENFTNISRNYAAKINLLQKTLGNPNGKIAGVLANPLEDKEVRDMLWWLIADNHCTIILDSNIVDGFSEVEFSSALDLISSREEPENYYVDPASPVSIYLRMCSEKSQFERRKVSAWIEAVIEKSGSQCIRPEADMSNELLAEALA